MSVICIIVGSIGDPNMDPAADVGSFRYCDELTSFLHGKTYTISSVPDKNITQKPIIRALRIQEPNTQSTLDNKSDIIRIQHPTNNTIGLNKITGYRCGEIDHKKINVPLKIMMYYDI